MAAVNDGIDERLFEYLVHSIENTGFYRQLGIKVNKIGAGIAELMVVAGQEHSNPLGVAHGGFVMGLVDGAMGNAVRSTGIAAVTTAYSAQLLAAAPVGQKVVARGMVVKKGRNIIFASGEAFCGDDIICKCTGTFFKTGDINI